jgi:hypothetical protein
MLRTRWAVDGPEGSFNKLSGHKLSSNDDDTPVLCNLKCMSVGRHLHIDDCRGDPHGPEVVHINERILPNLEQAKDLITHSLYWRRLGEFTPIASFEALLIRLSGFKGNGSQDSMGNLKADLSL